MADRPFPGRVDASSGEITTADFRGEVIVGPTGRVPTDFGAAEIYRF